MLGTSRIRRRLHRDERGQLMILMVAVVSVFLAVAVLGIDATLWHSQRRTAQKDSDAIALAAGQELLNRSVSTAQIITNGQSAAQTWATRNGIDSSYFTNGSPGVGCGVQAGGAANPSCVGSNGCFGSAPFDGKPDTVVADVSKQGTELFSKLWNVVAPDVGAHAKVCIGSPPDADGLLPFGIQTNPSVNPQCFTADGAPKFGANCDVTVRTSTDSETGILSLWNDNSLNCSAADVGTPFKNILTAEIADGAQTTCAIAPAGSDPNNCQILNGDGIGTCMYTQTGSGLVKAVIDGLQQRLAKEGSTTAPYNCDDRYPDSWFGASHVREHVDQWWEALLPGTADIHSVTPSSSVFFEKRACTSPRLVTLVLLDQFPATGQCAPKGCLIIGFAGFFITGCKDTTGAVNQRCVDNGAQNNGCGGGGCPNPTGEPILKNSGSLWLQGVFINYVEVGKRGGALNKYGRAQLFLVE